MAQSVMLFVIVVLCVGGGMFVGGQNDCSQIDLSRSLLLRERKLEDVQNPGLNFLAEVALEKICDTNMPSSRCSKRQPDVEVAELCEGPVYLVGIKEAASYGFNTRTKIHGLAIRSVIFFDTTSMGYELVQRLAVSDDGNGGLSMEAEDVIVLTHCLDEQVQTQGFEFESSCTVCGQGDFDPCFLSAQFGFPCAEPSMNETSAQTDIAALLGSQDLACS